jgi:metal-sulfur cluster biosynthetic enzyme
MGSKPNPSEALVITQEEVRTALRSVLDPEIGRPIE